MDAPERSEIAGALRIDRRPDGARAGGGRTVPCSIVGTDPRTAVTTSLPGRLPPRTSIAARSGLAVSGLSRRLGRGGGSVVGGRVMLAVDPGALRHLAAGRRSCLVSGTNGKTTTTSLLAAALATGGPVATNLLGANLPPGLASALAEDRSAGVAVLEVDEAWLARVVDATGPYVVLLLNLSRDQLDRNNEVRTLASGWRRALAGRAATTVVANADDPLVAWGAGAAADVRWVAAGQPWTADAASCPSCGGRITFADPTALPPEPAGAAGDASGWACSSCDHRRPPVSIWLEGDEVVTSTGRHALGLTLPGRANRANAAMALAAAVAVGVEPGAALEAMRAQREVVGRYRRVSVAGVDARMLLAKNPAGWLEVLDVVLPPPRPVVIAINARIADGRDPSWLWDVPFERLAGRTVIASGERGRDLVVRLHYADVEHRLVADPAAAVAAGAEAARAAGFDRFDVVANYTSFQGLRRALP